METGISRNTITGRIINYIIGLCFYVIYVLYNSKLAEWLRKPRKLITLLKLKNKVTFNYYRLLNKLKK